RARAWPARSWVSRSSTSGRCGPAATPLPPRAWTRPSTSQSDDGLASLTSSSGAVPPPGNVPSSPPKAPSSVSDDQTPSAPAVAEPDAAQTVADESLPMGTFGADGEYQPRQIVENDLDTPRRDAPTKTTA